MYRLWRQQGAALIRLRQDTTAQEAVLVQQLHRPSPGRELPPVTLPDLRRRAIDLARFRGRRVVLVLWSPGCGFCVSVAPELAELQRKLRRDGTEIVLLSHGDVESNRALLDEAGLACPVLLLSQPAPGIGTPTAYLLDEAGRLAAPPAVGAVGVSRLARELVATATPEPVAAGSQHTGG